MPLYTTRDRHARISLRECVLGNGPTDGALVMPTIRAPLPPSVLRSLQSLHNTEIAFEIARAVLSGEIEDSALQKIVDRTCNFPVPLVELHPHLYSLELFHGPTLAFKDFGARFLSGLVSHFASTLDRTLYVLVATSGDTGSAVAQGFLNAPGVRVLILYPSGGVSEVQEKQLTTVGNNVTALEVEGTFDDCQRLVKTAFTDQSLKDTISLTSANSINIGRLVPQSFYYFFGYKQLENPRLPLAYSVPCGNLGNLTGGVLAKQLGLPIAHFIAATNSNRVFPDYLISGTYTPRPSQRTISNAMDVGSPNNFERIVRFYNDSHSALTSAISGYTATDDETLQEMKVLYEGSNYLADPHGAVAFLGAKHFLASKVEPWNVIALETAHPAKFMDAVRKISPTLPLIPQRLQECLHRTKESVLIRAEYDEFVTYLRSLH